MERLTHKSRSEAGYKVNRGVPIWECLDKLGHLDDLQEQGRLPELPCAVGDTVYAPLHRPMMICGGIEEMKVLEVSDSRIWAGCDCFDYDDIGKNIFLTREEAEEALERIMNEQNKN